MIKSSSDRQPRKLHRNDCANFGIWGRGLRGPGLLQAPRSLAGQDGSSSERVMTFGSATALAQRGIGKAGPKEVYTGNEIKVKFPPARDGNPPGFLKTVIHAGRALDPDLGR